MGAGARQMNTGVIMKRMFEAAAVAVLLVGLALPVRAGEPRTNNLTVDYVDPRSAKFVPVMERLKQRQVLEALAQFLSPLRLPNLLRLKTKECGVINAFYDPSDWAINICYEWVYDTEEHAPKDPTPQGFTREDAIIGGFVGVVLHEAGHAVYDILDVPVLGREEDAADQIAAFMMLQFGKDVARKTINGFAYTWLSMASRSRPAYYDVHGTPMQRFQNFLCLAYGGEPVTFKDYIDKGMLPKDRAENCAAEYRQVRNAFLKTIYKHIDQEQMKKVQATQWLRPSDGK